jgi:hypothetical protein
MQSDDDPEHLGEDDGFVAEVRTPATHTAQSATAPPPLLLSVYGAAVLCSDTSCAAT